MSGPPSPFRKPTSRAFGPQSALGQANNADNISFGSLFSSPTGDSVFGGTSTPLFGFGFTQTPPLFSSRAAFSGSSSSAFGRSFGFGHSSASGLFGFTPAQTSSSGTTSHPSQPAFGSSIFNSSTPSGAQSQSELGASSTSRPSQPAFGRGISGFSTPFGAQSQSESSASSTPVFGSTTPAFGTTSTLAFVTDSAPSFGATSIPLFSSTMLAASGTGGIAFGATKDPIFGSGRAFGASSNPAVGASCSSSLSFGSSPAFGQSKTASRNDQFGSKFHGAHIGSQVATPTFGRTEFGKSSFGGQHRGSRVAPFSPTTEEDTGVQASILQSICGMSVPVYKYTSHEKLRWEDYQWGDKGGPNHVGQSGVNVGPGASPVIPRPSFSHFPLFSSSTASNAAGTGGFGSAKAFGQSHCGQSSNGSSSVVEPALVTNPFGTLPAVQQLSIGCTEIGSPVQYGFSTMPVPFLYDGDNTPSKPEADDLFIPRGNPRSLVVGPEYWPAGEQKPSLLKKTSPCANDGVPKDGPLEERTNFVKANQKIRGVHDDSSIPNDEEYVIVKGAGESAIGYDYGAGIEALLPKLCWPDYYTEPHVKELAAKERAEPGFCCRVKDFVVGRLGYGHIKFVGETDVRRLDLESLIRFNNLEVIVYTDESKKPPIGQGLNKPAEVTLLNIKCIDKKNGKQYIEGPKVEKYKETLKKAAEEQGAEYVSYDPIKGEWKFKVRHLS